MPRWCTTPTNSGFFLIIGRQRIPGTTTVTCSNFETAHHMFAVGCCRSKSCAHNALVCRFTREITKHSIFMQSTLQLSLLATSYKSPNCHNVEKLFTNRLLRLEPHKHAEACCTQTNVQLRCAHFPTTVQLIYFERMATAYRPLLPGEPRTQYFRHVS